MALTKVTGHVVKPDTNIQFHNTKSTGIVTFAHTSNATSSTTGALQITGGVGIVKDLHVGGNVTVGGTLTYDDVTNIDSLGIITARGGIHIGPITAGVATVYTNGNASFTGIITATSFVGPLTGTASGNATISNNANNRVITGGSGNVLVAETGLTYDTQVLRLNNTAANPQFHLTSADNGISELKFGDQSDLTRAVILYRSGSAGDALCFNGYNNTERMRISSTGLVGINETNPIHQLSIGINTSTAYTTSKNISNTTNNDFIGLNLTNENTGSNPEIGIMLQAGTSGAGQYTLNCLRTASGTADLIFRTRAGGGSSSAEVLRITSSGFVGINDGAPKTGLTIGKLGDYSANDGNTYYMPVGKWSSAWNAANAIVDNTDYWVGFVGGYHKSGNSVNIALSPNRGNVSAQQGMYISGEGTGGSTADFALGKIVGGSSTGQGTSGNVRATKSELFRITNAGNVGIGSIIPSDTLDISKHANHGITLKRPAGLSNPGQISLQVSSHGEGHLKANRHLNLYFDDDNGNNQFFRIYSDTTEVFNVTSAGEVNIHSGSNSLGTLRIGGDYDSLGQTNSTAKLGTLMMPHYTNAEEPIQMIRGYSDSARSLVQMGGGTTSANAATEIELITANTITGNGVARLSIDEDGKSVFRKDAGSTNNTYSIVAELNAKTSGSAAADFGPALYLSHTFGGTNYAGSLITGQTNADVNTQDIVFYPRNYGWTEALRITSAGTIFSKSPSDAIPNLKIRSDDVNWHGYLNQTVHGASISTILSCGGTWNVDGTTYSATKDYNGSFCTGALIIHNQYNSNATGAQLSFLTKANGSSTTDGAVTERFRIDNVGVLYTGNYHTTLDATPGSIQMNGGSSGARLSLRGTTTSQYGGLGEMHGWWDTNKVASILFHAGADTSNKDDGEIRMYTRTSGGSSAQRFRIDSTGVCVFGSGDTYASNTVSIHPSDGMVNFGMDGRSSLMTGQNSCYIFSGEGASGDMPAGTLVLQSRANVDRNILFATGSTPARKWAISGAGSVGGRLRAYSGSNTDGQMFDFYRPLTGQLPTANSGVETTIITTNQIADAGAYILILRSFEQSVTGSKLWSVRVVSSVFYIHSGSGNDGEQVTIPVTYSGHHNAGTTQSTNGDGPVTIKMHFYNGSAHTHGKITYTPNGFSYSGTNCDYYFYKLIDV